MNPRPSSRIDHSEDPPPVVTPEIAAEAAVWIARLHGPDRSVRMERECLDWQHRSAAHRRAFERCTDIWEEVPRVTLGTAYATASSQGAESDDSGGAYRPKRARWPLALAAVALLSLGVLFIQLWLDLGVHSTGVGGQQLVVLGDGTRMSLNTSTRVRVELGADRRSVSIEGGEALFEVAKDPRRPFVVRAGASEVVALGTVFSVRLDASRAHDDDALAVTLIEGRITLQPAHAGRSDGLAPARPLSMQPGERVRLTRAAGKAEDAAVAQVDRPRIESVVAWKRSEAIFDDATLAEAVAELNRYNRTPIVLVGGVSLANLRVSGIYRTGDTASFARDVAALHGLVVRERNGRLELETTQGGKP